MRRNVERPSLSVRGAIGNYREVFANPRSKLLYGWSSPKARWSSGCRPISLRFWRSVPGRRARGRVRDRWQRAWRADLRADHPGLDALARTGRMAVLGGVADGAGLSRVRPELAVVDGIPVFMVQGLGFFLLHGTFQAEATELAPFARIGGIVFACFCSVGMRLDRSPLVHAACRWRDGRDPGFRRSDRDGGAAGSRILGLRGRESDFYGQMIAT